MYISGMLINNTMLKWRLEPVTLEPVTLEPVTLEPVTLEPVTLGGKHTWGYDPRRLQSID